MTDTSPTLLLPRGIRNNNPGNIRWSEHVFPAGQAGCDDKGFCVFKETYYGLRYLYVILTNYHALDGCETLSDYIYRYAPPTENYTDLYVLSVSKTMSKARDYVLIVPDDLPALMKAIIIQENGSCPYGADDLNWPKLYHPIRV